MIAELLGLLVLIHDGDSQWYQSLRDKDGRSCCNMHDCAPVDSRMSGDHYEAKLPDGQWIVIPSDVVLKRDNPEGLAVLCRGNTTGIVKCFVPPNET